MSVYQMFGDYPILLLPPDLDKEATQKSNLVAADVWEADSGSAFRATYSALPGAQEPITFLLQTRDELAEMELFLNLVAGRASGWWLPTWNDDVTVDSSTASTLRIHDINYGGNMFPALPLRYLFYCSRSDPFTWGVRNVSRVFAEDTGLELLYTSSFNVEPATTSRTQRFMFLRHVRLESDSVAIEYLDGEKSLVTLSILNVPGSYPPFNVAASTPVYLSVLDGSDDAKLANVGGIPPGEPLFPGGGTITVSAVPIPCSPPGPCPIVGSGVEATHRTAPLAATRLTGQISLVTAAFSLANAEVYGYNGTRAIINVERDGVDIPLGSTNYWGGSFAGGEVRGETGWIDFYILDGDVIRVDFTSRIELQPGFSDDGARCKTFYGGNWQSWLYLPGFVTTL